MPFPKGLRPYFPCPAMVAAVVLSWQPLAALLSQSLEYLEQRGSEVFEYHYTFTETEKGYRIFVHRMKGNDTTDWQVLTTGPGFKTLSWRYVRMGEETDVEARLLHDGVQIRGRLDGKKIDELEKPGKGEPWIQLFPMNPGMEQFIFSAEDEIVFWSIGTERPADMEINSFKAKRKEVAWSDDFGCEVLRINFAPTGWRSYFWNGDYYFRPSDGRVIGYRGDGAPGKPSSKTTLVREN
jgi:hypothetical protein